MLRISDIRLPLDHGDDALRAAAIARLKIKPLDLVGLSVFRRGWDARKRSAIQLVYTLDIELADEAKVLARHAGDPHIRPAPDMAYRLLGRATHRPRRRPVVIGAGPCGLFATLVLAEMGLAPILLERGKVVRERTKDTWSLWRKSILRIGTAIGWSIG